MQVDADLRPKEGSRPTTPDRTRGETGTGVKNVPGTEEAAEAANQSTKQQSAQSKSLLTEDGPRFATFFGRAGAEEAAEAANQSAKQQSAHSRVPGELVL